MLNRECFSCFRFLNQLNCSSSIKTQTTFREYAAFSVVSLARSRYGKIFESHRKCALLISICKLKFELPKASCSALIVIYRIDIISCENLTKYLFEIFFEVCVYSMYRADQLRCSLTCCVYFNRFYNHC